MRCDRQALLGRVEDRLSTLSRWLAARRVAGEQRLERLHAHLESVRREMRNEMKQSAQDGLARARATVDEMEREDEIPQLQGPLRREELHALRRHVQLTATLLPHMSSLDAPGWGAAHEEYERSWEEVHRAFEAQGGTAVTIGALTGVAAASRARRERRRALEVASWRFRSFLDCRGNDARPSSRSLLASGPPCPAKREPPAPAHAPRNSRDGGHFGILGTDRR